MFADLHRLTQTVPVGAALGVAVSGGADSVCLLHTLHSLGYYRLCVLHVNHGLRGDESNSDEELVRKMAERLGLPYAVRHVDADAFSDLKNTSLEEAMRTQRHHLLAEMAHSFGAQFVAIGHTADDLAESLLMAILRGAGSAGLAFDFASQREGATHLRPLWKTPRTEIEEYCRVHNLEYATDSTNTDTQFLRNKIRHELVPYLEQNFNPRARANLAASAVAIGQLCATHKPTLAENGDDKTLACSSVLSRPQCEQSDLIYRWLARATRRVPTRHLIDAAIQLMLQPSETANSTRVAPTMQLARHANTLCIVEVNPDLPDTPEAQTGRWLAARSCRENPELLCAQIAVPIAVVFENSVFCTTLTDITAQTIQIRLTQNMRNNAPQLFLRNRRAGDTVARSSVRLKHLLNADKVAPYLRDFFIYLTDGGGQVYGAVHSPRLQKRISNASGITYHWEITKTATP